MHLKLDRKDIIIMASMTLVYLVIALFNLGSLNIPNTSWKPAKAGENFILDFGRNINLSRICIYSASGQIKYAIEFMDKNGQFQPFMSFKNDEHDDTMYFYKGICISGNDESKYLTTKRLKLTADVPGGGLNEIAVYEKGSRKPVGNIKITGATDPSDTGALHNLLDEQNKVEYAPSFMTQTNFDETMHARTASEILYGLEPHEITHPYLGHILLSVGIALFGMNPFGWRIIGTLFGAAMIPLMYIFGRKLFGRRFYGFCAAFLMMFDFMHFVQTREGAIDVYVTFFIILMYYYMYDYYSNKSYSLGFKQSMKPLVLSGLFFGLGVACKWIALYGAPGLALLFLLAKREEYRDYTALSRKKSSEHAWVKIFIPVYIKKTMLFCVLFFIVVPAVIYLLSYIPYMMAGHGFSEVLERQIFMIKRQINVVYTKEFVSQWWSWPLILTPCRYIEGVGLPSDRVSTIFAMGNPAIWWAGILSVIAMVAAAFNKRDKKMVLIITAVAFQYLPWMLVTRATFIYHFFSVVPFMILALVYTIKYLLERFPKVKVGVYIYLGITVVLFIMFYPILSGMEVDKSYVSNYLIWFKGFWKFL